MELSGSFGVLLIRTFKEVVRGELGLDTLQSHRDRAKLKWEYMCKLAIYVHCLQIRRYPKQLICSGILNHIEGDKGKCGVGNTYTHAHTHTPVLTFLQ